jgi:ribosomal protein L37AE/L43A
MAFPSDAVMRGAISAALDEGHIPFFSPPSNDWRLRIVDPRDGAGADIDLTDARGDMNRWGSLYALYARRHGLPPRLHVFRPGTHLVARSTVAVDLRGEPHDIRRWNALRQCEEQTPMGDQYYAAHRQEITVELPVIRYRGNYRGGGYSRINDAPPYVVPATDEFLEQFNPDFPRFAPSHLNQAAALDHVRQAVDDYIAQLPLVDGNLDADPAGPYRLLTDYDQSDLVFVLDPDREITYDEMTNHVPVHGDVYATVVRDRLLRGIVVVPDEMYAKTGLFPVAFEDTSNRGGCVPVQLVLAITKRVDHDSRKRQRRLGPNGKKITLKPGDQGYREPEEDDDRGGQRWENVPKYAIDEMAAKIDAYFEARYPAIIVDGPAPYADYAQMEEDYRLAMKAYDRRVAYVNAHNMGHWTGLRQMLPYPEEPVRPGAPARRVRPAPYEHGDWRQIGVTSPLIADVCNGEGLVCHILHCDKKIQTFLPANPRPGTNNYSVCFNIWGDHAFFYDGSTREGHNAKANIGSMKVVVPASQPGIQLLQPTDENSRVKYSDMTPYTEELLDHLVSMRVKGTLYIDHVTEVIRHCQEAKYKFERLLGSDPNVVTGVSVHVPLKDGNCTYVSVKCIPREHKRLARFCELLPFQMEYYGESPPSLALSALNALLIKKRMKPTPAILKALRSRQHDVCACCGDSLGFSIMDHVKPLCEGGSNDLENLQLICIACEASKTEKEESSRTPFHTLESHLAPSLVKSFHETPKQKMAFGCWKPPPAKTTMVKTVDVISCRVNALVKYPRGLPIFSPLDEIETILDEDCRERRRLDEYDYVWVEREIYVNDDLEGDSVAAMEEAIPYTGKMWYCIEAVLYMLRTGAITRDNLVYGLKATRHVDPAVLHGAFETMRGCMKQAFEEELAADNVEPDGTEEAQCSFAVKTFILSMIGLMNSTERLKWKEVRSTTADDCRGPVKRRKYIGDGIWQFKICTKLVTTGSYRPIGQIALNMERVRCDQMRRALNHMPGVVTYSHKVDDTALHLTGFEDPVAAFVESARHPDGTPIFRMKDERSNRMPRSAEQLVLTDGDVKVSDFQWRILRESDGGDDPQIFFAKEIFKNGGGFLPGRGGVGKTFTVKHLKRLIEEDCKARGVKCKIVCCALRHLSKVLMEDGQTICHAIHKYAKAQEYWIIIDECSEIALSLLAAMANWKLVGWNFVVCGDYAGQLLPITDRWGDAVAAKGIEWSRFLGELVNGLRCELTKNRRSGDDLCHTANLESLYSLRYYRPGSPVDGAGAQADLKAALARLCTQYRPQKEMLCEAVVATMSHRLRLQMNAYFNTILKERQADKFFMSWHGAPVLRCCIQPQSAYYWKGMVLVGCNKGNVKKALKPVLNGVFYEIVDFSHDTVTLRMHDSCSATYVAKQVARQEALRRFAQPFIDSVGAGTFSVAECEMHLAIAGALADVSATDALSAMGFAVDGGNVVVEGDEASKPLVRPRPPPFVLSRADFQTALRLTHALPYPYFQGRTLTDQKLLLMDVRHRHFTMRHLIMGLGRVTKGADVWICPPALEKCLKDAAELVYNEQLHAARQACCLADEQVPEPFQLMEPESEGESELPASDDEDELPPDVDGVPDDLF